MVPSYCVVVVGALSVGARIGVPTSVCEGSTEGYCRRASRPYYDDPSLEPDGSCLASD